ncbi:MAG: endonuclease domain-containing protein [Actinomycetota bacterium]|nr:endonuclease domain-containing protein [Actinomycetota bacterium]
MAKVIDRATLEIALDDAIRTQRTSPRRLRTRLACLGGKGHRGTTVLGKLIVERDATVGRAESELEVKMLRLLRRAGLPPPAPQHVIRDGGRFVARIDFAYPEHRLAIQMDGYAWHSRRAAWQRDLEVNNHLERLGWHLLRFSWNDADARQAYVTDSVSTSLAELSSHR